MEEALYESVSMRTFAGIDLGRESAPDETTVCKFRHLLEQNGLGNGSRAKAAWARLIVPTVSRSRSASSRRGGKRAPDGSCPLSIALTIALTTAR